MHYRDTIDKLLELVSEEVDSNGGNFNWIIENPEAYERMVSGLMARLNFYGFKIEKGKDANGND